MSDPIRELNNYLQEVKKPQNLVPLLQFRSEQSGPNHQATHTGIYIFRSVEAGRHAATTIKVAKRGAATQALQYFRRHGVPE